MNKKNILFISPFYPHKDESPRHRAVYNHINYFKSKNFNVTFIYLSNHEINLNLNIEFIRLPLPSNFEVLKNIFLQIFLFKKESLQTSLYYSKSVGEYLRKMSLKKTFDIIFFESIRTIPYQNYFKDSYKILDLGDLISRRYNLLRRSKIKVNNILGQFSNKSFFLNFFLKNFFVQKIILFVEEKLIRKMEIKSLKDFDKIILVSHYEKSLLSKYSSRANVHWIPNIDLSKSLNIPKFTFNKSISYFGILNNPHNEHALIYFFENIFDKIIKIDRDIIFKIFGKHPTKKIAYFAQKYPKNVILKGYVKNLEHNVKKSNLLIIPIQAGSGVKTKVLDAISWGVPVVSSMEGVSGLVSLNESGIIVAKNDLDFAEEVLRLIKQYNLAKKLSMKSFKYYNKYYSKDAVFSKYDSILS